MLSASSHLAKWAAGKWRSRRVFLEGESGVRRELATTVHRSTYGNDMQGVEAAMGMLKSITTRYYQPAHMK